MDTSKDADRGVERVFGDTRYAHMTITQRYQALFNWIAL